MASPSAYCFGVEEENNENEWQTTAKSASKGISFILELDDSKWRNEENKQKIESLK